MPVQFSQKLLRRLRIPALVFDIARSDISNDSRVARNLFLVHDGRLPRERIIIAQTRNEGSSARITISQQVSRYRVGNPGTPTWSYIFILVQTCCRTIRSHSLSRIHWCSSELLLSKTLLDPGNSPHAAARIPVAATVRLRTKTKSARLSAYRIGKE
jgi:hypothetical protein